MKRNLIVWRVVGAVLLLVLLVGGGIMAYRAGVVSGVRQAPEMAEVFSQAYEEGQFPMHSFGGFRTPMYGMHGRGFFPMGGLFGLFLAFLFFGGLMRLLFFPHRAYWGMHHGPARGGYWGDPCGESHPGKPAQDPETKDA